MNCLICDQFQLSNSMRSTHTTGMTRHGDTADLSSLGEASPDARKNPSTASAGTYLTSAVAPHTGHTPSTGGLTSHKVDWYITQSNQAHYQQSNDFSSRTDVGGYVSLIPRQHPSFLLLYSAGGGSFNKNASLFWNVPLRTTIYNPKPCQIRSSGPE